MHADDLVAASTARAARRRSHSTAHRRQDPRLPVRASRDPGLGQREAARGVSRAAAAQARSTASGSAQSKASASSSVEEAAERQARNWRASALVLPRASEHDDQDDSGTWSRRPIRRRRDVALVEEEQERLPAAPGNRRMCGVARQWWSCGSPSGTAPGTVATTPATSRSRSAASRVASLTRSAAASSAATANAAAPATSCVPERRPRCRPPPCTRADSPACRDTTSAPYAHRPADLVCRDAQRHEPRRPLGLTPPLREAPRHMAERGDRVEMERDFGPAAASARRAASSTVPTSLFATRAVASAAPGSAAANRSAGIRPRRPARPGAQRRARDEFFFACSHLHGVQGRVVLAVREDDRVAPCHASPPQALERKVHRLGAPEGEPTSIGSQPSTAARRSRASSRSRRASCPAPWIDEALPTVSDAAIHASRASARGGVVAA